MINRIQSNAAENVENGNGERDQFGQDNRWLGVEYPSIVMASHNDAGGNTSKVIKGYYSVHKKLTALKLGKSTITSNLTTALSL